MSTPSLAPKLTDDVTVYLVLNDFGLPTGFFVRRRRVSQTPEIDSQDHLICLRCRAAMSLTYTNEEYPGYQRRVFECPVCGETMTQWAGVSRASSSAGAKQFLGCYA